MTLQTAATIDVMALPVTPFDKENFAPFGQVIVAGEDGEPFGIEDAQLDLSGGIPRFYIMKLLHRGLRVKQITRHRQVTQCLASVGGKPWLVAVAPPKNIDDPEAQPDLADIVAFRIPGDVAIKLHKGTWHAGPFFVDDEISFFNLELADTNQVDHHNCHLDRRYGVVLEFQS